jgi:glycine cleavage system H protein
MADAQVKTIHYRRSHFVTQLPVDYLYSPSHCWLAREPEDYWQVGLTKFATRMLGEMVDHGFEVEPGAVVEIGQILGWIEGFKAISDLFCVVQGRFVESNGVLKERIQLVTKDCYKDGWLYRIQGGADVRCLDVHAYIKVLDKTIDRILEKQKSEEIQ